MSFNHRETVSLGMIERYSIQRRISTLSGTAEISAWLEDLPLRGRKRRELDSLLS